MAVVSDLSQENPKLIQALKDGKVPMEFIPWNPLAQMARVMKLGADKYGTRNWRIDPIKASTYEGAIARHAFLEWAAGVNVDHESGQHPLAHVMACCAIVIDAEGWNMLIDDRDRKVSKSQQAAGLIQLGVPSRGR